MALQKRNKTFADYVKEIFTVVDTVKRYIQGEKAREREKQTDAFVLG